MLGQSSTAGDHLWQLPVSTATGAVLEQSSPFLSLHPRSREESRRPKPAFGREWHCSLQVFVGGPLCCVSVSVEIPACP